MSPVPDRAAIIASINRSVLERAAKDMLQADKVIRQILDKCNVTGYSYSQEALNEVCFSCAKDLEKIAIYQNDRVNELKTFSYFCFWIRKLKPIQRAMRDGREFKEVNEHLSVWMLMSLVSRHYKDLAAKDRSRLPELNSRVDALSRLLGDKARMDYLVHCMRTRTFGPHHFVMLLQNVG